MAKRIKLTPHQRDALTTLSASNGPVRWDVLRAPGPTLARLQEMEMVERRKIGSWAAWIITDAGRAALAST